MPQQGLQVLMIAPTSFFSDYGCHVRILEEATVLKHRGHQVTVCTYPGGQDIAGLNIERTLPVPWHRQHEVGSSLDKILLDALLLPKAIRVAMRKRPDLIHAHLHEGALIGYFLHLLFRVPLVFDFQGSLTGEMMDHNFLQRDSIFYGPLRRLEMILDKVPRVVLSSSDHGANLLRNEFGCTNAKIHVLPDCVDTEVFSPLKDKEKKRKLKSELGLPHDSLVVVYLGLLAEYQGISLLLQAVSHLKQWPNLYYLIMGYPFVEQYSALAERLGVKNRVIFTGRVPYHLAPQYLSVGDIAVALKMSATEGMGKLPKYMAMGLPTVAFDAPVAREYLGELGVYARFGEEESLAQAIASLAEDPVRQTELGCRLRRCAEERYSLERLGQKLLEAYEVCLNGS